METINKDSEAGRVQALEVRDIVFYIERGDRRTRGQEKDRT